MDLWLFLLILYIPLDIFLAFISIGFYQSTGSFDASLIYKYLFFLDGYQYTTSPIDFVFVAFVRFICLSGVILLHVVKFKRKENFFMPLILIAVMSYSYSLAKLLALSEEGNQLSYPGLWLSIGWSIISSGIFAGLCYVLLKRKPAGYEPLEEEGTSQEVNTTHTSEANENNTENSRAGTLKHVVKLLSYCKLEWEWFTLGFIFLSVYAFIRVFIPSMMGNVIADIVKTKGMEKLTHSILYMAALSVASSIFGGLRGGCFDYATARVHRQVRQDLFSSLVRQDIAFFDMTKSGEMVSRLTSDCMTISSTISTNLNVFLRNGVMLIGALIYMFVLSWRLATVTFIAIPLVGFITKWYGAYFDKISEKTQETISKANHVAEEVLSTMRTVRSFACETREAKRFEDHLNVTLGISKKKAVTYMSYTWTNELCENAILVGVLFYGGSLVLKELMTAEQLITFLLYQLQLGENLYNIGYVFTGLMESVGASRKVFEYMNRTPDIPLDGNEKPAVNGHIEFKDVHFTYPSRRNNPVLQGLNLDIEPGQTMALVGPSGGGKSSIVSLLEHFYEPESGEILLDKVPIKDIDHWFYHQKISLVAQEPVLYDGSVRHNILYGCEWATEDDMLRAAKMANVHDFVMELEKGYDTACGEKGVQMSGGQKQRIAIARALVRRPAVLILDEATSALDAESEALVQDALNRCARERTVLIIAHRLSTIEKADKIAVIQKGRVIQTGKHLELMEDREGLYYSLVARQLLATKTGEVE